MTTNPHLVTDHEHVEKNARFRRQARRDKWRFALCEMRDTALLMLTIAMIVIAWDGHPTPARALFLGAMFSLSTGPLRRLLDWRRIDALKSINARLERQLEPEYRVADEK